MTIFSPVNFMHQVHYITQLVDSLSNVGHHGKPTVIDYPPGVVIGFVAGLLVGMIGMLLLD
jgi:hypothetical protein